MADHRSSDRRLAPASQQPSRAAVRRPQSAASRRRACAVARGHRARSGHASDATSGMTQARKPKPIPGVEIRQRKRRDGTVYWQYRVRWTDPGTRKRRVEIFDKPDDAQDFQASLRLLKRRGQLEDLDRGRQLLVDFFHEVYWPSAVRTLERNTIESYASAWNLHILPQLGVLQLRQIDAATVYAWAEQLAANGVGGPTIKKALTVVQAVLAEAGAATRSAPRPRLGCGSRSAPPERWSTARRQPRSRRSAATSTPPGRPSCRCSPTKDYARRRHSRSSIPRSAAARSRWTTGLSGANASRRPRHTSPGRRSCSSPSARISPPGGSNARSPPMRWGCCSPAQTVSRGSCTTTATGAAGHSARRSRRRARRSAGHTTCGTPAPA